MIILSHIRGLSTLSRILAATALLFGIGIAPTPGGPLGSSHALAQTAPLSAELHECLGRAAGGLRTGGSVFVVTTCDLPCEVAAVKEDRAEAEAVATELEGSGAYCVHEVVTGFEFERPAYVAGIGHLPGSWCYPDFRGCLSMNLANQRVLVSNWDSTQVTIFHDGDPIIWRFGRHEIDALFFTYSAFEKFFAPYIAREYGARRAEEVRQQFEVYLRER